MGKPLEGAKPGNIEVTLITPAAKRQRRCVQSKLCLVQPKGGGVVLGFDESGEKKRGEESTGKGRKGKAKPTTPKKSPVTRKGLRTGSKSPSKSPGHNSCRKLKNQNGDASKSDTTKDFDGPFLCPEKPTSSCNLWLEAKLANEENTCLSAGKQINPLCPSRKEAKQMPETQDIMKPGEGRPLPGYDGDDAISYPPFHILDTEVDAITLDWSNWNLMEQTLDMNDGNRMEIFLADCGRLVEPLRFDTVLKEMHADQLSIAAEKKSATTTTTTDNNQYKKQSSSEIHPNSNFSFLLRCGTWTENSEDSHQDGFHKERLLSYYERSNYWPECSLWTSKYRPENAFEVCGNPHSVMQLNEWLKSWNERAKRSAQNCKVEERHALEDTEDGLYKTGSDMDQDAPKHRNVLLITGPVGSGKSAAIYACAKEQGFSVIEISASDSRDGASIKNKFWGTMESHRYKRWCFDNYNITIRKQNLDGLPGIPGTIGNVKLENLEVMPRTDVQDSGCGGCSWDGRTGVGNELLILFENVDTIFEEDRGFISSILHLAENENQPIILTSNKKNPALPPPLDQLVLDFELPSFEELFRHIRMICACEKTEVPAHILQHLIHSCLGDIRKIIMLLQFWCQGNHHVGRNMHMSSSLCFDIDAAHLLLPISIPWGFRCELSEKVADELSRTISSIEDNLKLVEPCPIEKGSSLEMGKMPEVSSKRKCRLSRKISDPNSTEFPANENYLDDFFDATECIARSNQQGDKRRPHVVLSSESDERSSAGGLQPTEVVSPDMNNLHFPYTSIDPVLDTLQVPCPLSSPADSTHQSQRDNGVSNLLESFTMASASCICDTFKLQDVSCVPESSFLSGFDDATSVAVSSNIITASLGELVHSVHSSPKEVNNVNGPISDLNLCPISNINEVDFESVFGNEGLGDSYNAVEKLPLSSEFQFLDECSRADFSIGLVPQKCGEKSPGIFSVQETWQKLRNQHEELKPFLNRSQRESSIVNLAAILTDLISETDIMFSGCNPLICDVLEPSLTPSVEPDDFSWYDEQYRMGSTYSQHGLCLFLKECEKTCQDLGFIEAGVLVQEMLASSTNPMVLGKLLSLESTNTQDTSQGGFHMKEIGHCISTRRVSQSVLLDALLPMVPARLSMTLRGSGFHDYLSFTSHISKVENARISQSMKEDCRRRPRSSHHYLSSGSLLLSSEDVELLARTSCFKEAVPL